jgi:GT2 family glycosyltransferase
LETVFAIIVTYKRPDKLADCLQSLLTQVSYGLKKIHVVVNSADEKTLSVIREFSETALVAITFEKLSNEGPAGGFHSGLSRFLEQSAFSHAWLMDDDIVIKSNCLEEMLRCGQPYVYPKVLTEKGHELRSFGWWGVLLRRDVVEKAGLPLRELFYWAEDTEYLQDRIMRKLHYEPFRCDEAHVEHWHQRSIKRPSWYYYYAPRNTLYYRTYIAGYTWYRFRRTLLLVPQLLVTILRKEDRKIKKISLMLYGLIHGLARKTGKQIDPEKHL